MSTVKVSRNEPCPCGSGKKYKKCCGKKDAVSITDLMENEIIDLQKEARVFAFQNYAKVLEHDYKDLRNMLENADHDDIDFYKFIHPFWYIVFKPLEDGETIMQKYIAQKMPAVVRPRLKTIFQSWTNGTAVAGKVIKVEGKTLVIKNTLTEKEFNIYLPDHMKDYNVGVYAFGILLPYEDKFTVFPGLFDITNQDTAGYEAFIKSEFVNSGMENAGEFLAMRLLELMFETPNADASIDMDSFEWPNSGAKDVAVMFEKDMDEAGELQWVKELGITLWMDFCSRTNKRIMKPANYVAGLRYLVSTVASTDENLTQKQLGEIYGLTASRVSSYYSDIYSVLEDKMEQLAKEAEQEPVLV